MYFLRLFNICLLLIVSIWNKSSSSIKLETEFRQLPLEWEILSTFTRKSRLSQCRRRDSCHCGVIIINVTLALVQVRIFLIADTSWKFTASSMFLSIFTGMANCDDTKTVNIIKITLSKMTCRDRSKVFYILFWHKILEFGCIAIEENSTTLMFFSQAAWCFLIISY